MLDKLVQGRRSVDVQTHAHGIIEGSAEDRCRSTCGGQLASKNNYFR